MALITYSSPLDVVDMWIRQTTKLRRGTTKYIYILSVLGATDVQYRHCPIELSEHFIRNAGSLRTGLVISWSLVVSRYIPLVPTLCSVQFAFHRTYTGTFSTVVCLWWYFRRTLMNAMSCSLGVSMSYFTNGWAEIHEREWISSD